MKLHEEQLTAVLDALQSFVTAVDEVTDDDTVSFLEEIFHDNHLADVQHAMFCIKMAMMNRGQL
jgi:hypothetical protein